MNLIGNYINLAVSIENISNLYGFIHEGTVPEFEGGFNGFSYDY